MRHIFRGIPLANAKSGFTIEQLKAVLAELGSPHINIPVISVAGTNGKGSVSGLIKNMLVGSGKKIGVFTSPHVFKFTERIKINDKPIDIGRFKSILKKMGH